MTGSPRTLLPRIGICICFALMATWLRFTAAPPIFPPTYMSRFVLFSALLITIVIWFACGMPGLAALRRERVRALMLLCLLLLAGWAYASQSWGYAADRQPAHGLNAALSWCVVALFCVVVASAAPPPAWIAGTLIGVTLINAALAAAQVANGGWLGWWRLGEFRFNAALDGTSLIQSGDITFVRPYGLLAHPNMLGGLLVVGVLLAAGWYAGGRAGRRGPGEDANAPKAESGRASVFSFVLLSAFALLLGALLLTFSRAAWIGLAAGGLAWLGMVVWRRFLPLILIALVVGGLFVAQYRPLLLARVGDGSESLELRSVSDRLVYTDFALRAIAERPLVGQGAGYFPWRAAAYIEETFFDLRGDHVHQVYLSAWAELGLVGFVLMILALCLGIEAGLSAVRSAVPTERALRAAMLASVIGLATVGLFDHYPYSQLPFMALWWGLLAAI